MADIDLPQRRILHDTGYLDASRTALENLAKAMERERAWAITADGRHVVLHAADVAREQREQKEAAEAAAEAERLAAPDPRETLRAALQLQREAENEVVRVTGQLERAKELVTSLEERVGDQQGRIAAGEAAAVAHR